MLVPLPAGPRRSDAGSFFWLALMSPFSACATCILTGQQAVGIAIKSSDVGSGPGSFRLTVLPPGGVSELHRPRQKAPSSHGPTSWRFGGCEKFQADGVEGAVQRTSIHSLLTFWHTYFVHVRGVCVCVCTCIFTFFFFFCRTIWDFQT